MKKIILALIILLSLASISFADISLYAFATDKLLSGVRIGITDNISVDLAGTGKSGDSGSTSMLYGDIFYGNFGFGVLAKKPDVNTDTSYELSLQYAMEYPINDKIKLGILAILVNYDTTKDIDPNISCVPFVGPYIVLAL